jgi:hypothetical protein
MLSIGACMSHLFSLDFCDWVPRLLGTAKEAGNADQVLGQFHLGAVAK